MCCVSPCMLILCTCVYVCQNYVVTRNIIIRASVDALCRDARGQISCNLHTKCLETWPECLAKASKLTRNCLQTNTLIPKVLLCMCLQHSINVRDFFHSQFHKFLVIIIFFSKPANLILDRVDALIYFTMHLQGICPK